MIKMRSYLVPKMNSVKFGLLILIISLVSISLVSAGIFDIFKEVFFSGNSHITGRAIDGLCNDTDAGKNYFFKDSCSSPSISPVYDECVGEQLKEWFCDEENNSASSDCVYELINCSDKYGSNYDCSDGKCVCYEDINASCQGTKCGSVKSVCGNYVSCGSCSAGECVDGQCIDFGITPSAPSFSKSSLTGSDLVAYYDFESISSDGKIDDVSAYDNKAVKAGNPRLSSYGVLGKSIYFNGISDYFSIATVLGSSLLLTTNSPFTVSVWVKPGWAPTDSLANSNIFGTSKGYFLDAMRSSEDKPHFSIYPPITGSEMSVGAGGSKSLTEGVWNHLVATYTSTPTTKTMVLYLNGESVQSKPFTTTNSFQMAVAPFYIGKNYAANSGYFKGNIDELKVWKRALTLQEITQLHNDDKVLLNPISLANSKINGICEPGEEASNECSLDVTGYNDDPNVVEFKGCINITGTAMSGKTYKLVENMQVLSGDAIHESNSCIRISGASKVTLDCDGKTISSSDLIKAIYINWGSYNTIKNCNIAVGKGTTQDAYELSGGIFVFGTHNLITKNKITNGGSGISTYGDNNTIYLNHAENTIKGINVRTASGYMNNPIGDIVRENLAINNNQLQGWGFSSWSGNNTIFINNKAYGNRYGYVLYGGTNVQVYLPDGLDPKTLLFENSANNIYIYPNTPKAVLSQSLQSSAGIYQGTAVYSWPITITYPAVCAWKIDCTWINDVCVSGCQYNDQRLNVDGGGICRDSRGIDYKDNAIPNTNNLNVYSCPSGNIGYCQSSVVTCSSVYPDNGGDYCGGSGVEDDPLVCQPSRGETWASGKPECIDSDGNKIIYFNGCMPLKNYNDRRQMTYIMRNNIVPQDSQNPCITFENDNITLDGIYGGNAYKISNTAWKGTSASPKIAVDTKASSGSVVQNMYIEIGKDTDPVESYGIKTSTSKNYLPSPAPGVPGQGVEISNNKIISAATGIYSAGSGVPYIMNNDIKDNLRGINVKRATLINNAPVSNRFPIAGEDPDCSLGNSCDTSKGWGVGIFDAVSGSNYGALIGGDDTSIGENSFSGIYIKGSKVIFSKDNLEVFDNTPYDLYIESSTVDVPAPWCCRVYVSEDYPATGDAPVCANFDSENECGYYPIIGNAIFSAEGSDDVINHDELIDIWISSDSEIRAKGCWDSDSDLDHLNGLNYERSGICKDTATRTEHADLCPNSTYIMESYCHDHGTPLVVEDDYCAYVKKPCNLALGSTGYQCFAPGFCSKTGFTTTSIISNTSTSSTSLSSTTSTTPTTASAASTVATSCVPKTCAAFSSVECGLVENGCGGYINCGECAQGYYCTSTRTCAVQGTSVLSDAYWFSSRISSGTSTLFTANAVKDENSDYTYQLSAIEGTEVLLVAEGINCEGKKVIFKIYEDDLLKDDLITTFEGVFVNDTAAARWDAEVFLDTFTMPEYYFTVELKDNPNKKLSSGMLPDKVLRINNKAKPECKSNSDCGQTSKESFCMNEGGVSKLCTSTNSPTCFNANKANAKCQPILDMICQECSLGCLDGKCL